MVQTKNFEDRLKGGHPNSLGNTIEVVEEVLEIPKHLPELFECYFSQDEIVRLRVSNAMKRIVKADKSLLIPYIDRLINEVSGIDQASTQWTLSQLFLALQEELTLDQKERALHIMKNNLACHTDWIVLNQTMETLGRWAKKDKELKSWLLQQLDKHKTDTRKSVRSKALKTASALS